MTLPLDPAAMVSIIRIYICMRHRGGAFVVRRRRTREAATGPGQWFRDARPNASYITEFNGCKHASRYGVDVITTYDVAEKMLFDNKKKNTRYVLFVYTRGSTKTIGPMVRPPTRRVYAARLSSRPFLPFDKL